MNNDKLITPKHYAKKYNVTRATVYNWIKQKKVVAIEIDGVKFIKTKNPKKN